MITELQDYRIGDLFILSSRRTFAAGWTHRQGRCTPCREDIYVSPCPRGFTPGYNLAGPTGLVLSGRYMYVKVGDRRRQRAQMMRA